MGEQLGELLPQLAGQGYAEIFVLDDASTDGSREKVGELDLDVRFVTGAVNRGAGAARNLIIDALDHDVLIHFIDADTSVLTDRTAERARDVMPSEPAGFVGGLALSHGELQNVWNYGPRQCLRSDVDAYLQDKIGRRIKAGDVEAAKELRARHDDRLADWPDPFSSPVRRQIFWNIEQNLVISSDVFAALGGFDERLREHEIQDLAIRMYRRGLLRYFDPSIAVQHKAIDVRGYNRQTAMARAEWQIHRTHGLRNWLRPDGRFHPSL